MRTYKIMGTDNSYTNFDFMKYMTFLRESDYEVEAKAFELLHQYHHDSVRDLAWQFMYNGELPSMENRWSYNTMDNKWYLWAYDKDEEDDVLIAEVGVEDGELEGEKSYYWIDCEDNCGYGDFYTVEEAKADAEKYFSKH